MLLPESRCRYKTYTPILNFPVTFAYFIGESWFFSAVTLIIAPCIYSYLLTDELLVNKNLCQFCGKHVQTTWWNKNFIRRPRPLLIYSYESLRHYKTYCWTSRSDNVRYINKTYYFVGCFGAPVGVATGSTAIGLHTTKLIYRTRIAGRRQVTVRFMN